MFIYSSRIPSSIRLTSNTLTVSSPKIPRNRPSVHFRMILRTSSSVISFAFAIPYYLILRCRRGNMGIKPTAGTSNKIHQNSCFIHIRVGSPELFHPLCHELCILLACRRDVRRIFVALITEDFAGNRTRKKLTSQRMLLTLFHTSIDRGAY